jgi:anti-anti-sigma factor
MHKHEKTVVLPREVDIFMREQIREMLSLDDCTTLIVDMLLTRYIDGTGIGEIVRARNIAAATGKKVIVLVNKSSQIVRLFQVVHLFDILDIRVCESAQHKCA